MFQKYQCKKYQKRLENCSRLKETEEIYQPNTMYDPKTDIKDYQGIRIWRYIRYSIVSMLNFPVGIIMLWLCRTTPMFLGDTC